MRLCLQPDSSSDAIWFHSFAACRIYKECIHLRKSVTEFQTLALAALRRVAYSARSLLIWDIRPPAPIPAKVPAKGSPSKCTVALVPAASSVDDNLRASAQAP